VARSFFLLALLFTLPAAAQDVFVPPVPKGIVREGKVRTPARPIAFPDASTPWIRLRSERFDVLSASTESRTRSIISDVETLASALMRTSDRFAPSRARTTVFIFERRKESQPYFDLLFAREGATATGAYVRHDGGGTMFIDASSQRARAGGNAPFERTALHELVHDLLRQSDSAPPLWLEEGLAEYFSNAVVQGDRVFTGDPIREHLKLLQRRGTMPLVELFAVKAESAIGTSTAFYAQSWAVVDWLMGTSQSAFLPFLRDVERGTAVDEALRTHYRKSVADLETSVRWRDLNTHRITLRAGEKVSLGPTAPLDRATLLYELGHFLSYVAGAERESQRHYAEALRLDPKHARALAAVGELEASIAADPTDPEVHLLYAETLLTTATGPFAGVFEPKAGDVERFRKARALAERALALDAEKIDGGEGRARGIIGTTYLVESDVSAGIAQLERARTLAPQRMDFALNLYAMLLRTGAREKADTLYAAAFANARDQQTIFAARNVLLLSETARANAFAQTGKLDEAAGIVRALAASTPDPRGKRELEQQAANLEATSAINRHITTYNEAISLVNAGKKRDAVRLLDELLKVATDPELVGDAKELLAELRKKK
jgi:tetratricopeptide (TPR) repeat protein